MFPEMLIALVAAAIIGGLAVYLVNRATIRKMERGSLEAQRRLTHERLRCDDLTARISVMNRLEKERLAKQRASAAKATEARMASAAARRLLKSHQ